MQGLRPFKYKNTCDLCDKIFDKDNRGRITANKYSDICEKVIYVFHEKCYIPTIETPSFYLDYFSIISSMECWKT